MTATVLIVSVYAFGVATAVAIAIALWSEVEKARASDNAKSGNERLKWIADLLRLIAVALWATAGYEWTQFGGAPVLSTAVLIVSCIAAGAGAVWSGLLVLREMRPER